MENGPSFGHHLCTALTALVITEQHSRYPEAHWFIVMFCTPALLWLGVAYLWAIAKRFKRGADVRPRSIRSRARWLLFPFALLMMATSTITHWPATIRLQLSTPSFEELVAEAFTGSKPEGFPKRVGLYWIEGIYDAEFDYGKRKGRIGFVTGHPLIDDVGLFYDQTDSISTQGSLTTRISPRWYLTEW